MREGEPGFDDVFRPPDIPTEVHCIHCDEEYESYLIKWVPIDESNPSDGFWCCPTTGCDGIGFCFDIFPTDPEWRDENGEKVWAYFDDDEFGDEFGDDWDDAFDDDEFSGDAADEAGDESETEMDGLLDRDPDGQLGEDDLPF